MLWDGPARLPSKYASLNSFNALPSQGSRELSCLESDLAVIGKEEENWLILVPLEMRPVTLTLQHRAGMLYCEPVEP